jgi:hypothetical protein
MRTSLRHLIMTELLQFILGCRFRYATNQFSGPRVSRCTVLLDDLAAYLCLPKTISGMTRL